jgi:glycosyltransferase involved in cell wall biosynthesis
MKVSAIVITKNEERVIDRCLASLAWCDEIVLIDSSSTDRTVEIAHEHGARVVAPDDWQGFAEQRNRGLAAARNDWCLLVDADEWVTDGLRAEITRELAGPRHEAAFKIPRSSSYCGQFLRHSGWWPDYVTRLVHKGRARYAGMVHERCVPTGDLGRLSQPLKHESYRDLEQVLSKMNSYSTWGAQDLVAQGKRSSLSTALLHGVWTFLRTYFLRAGFLDGQRGLMVAISNAETTYYKYLKAYLLTENASRRQEEPFPPH